MDQNTKKILIFTTAFKPLIGGSEIAIENIAKNLPEFRFDIITPRYSPRHKTEEHNGNINIYRTGYFPFGFLNKMFFPFSGFAQAVSLNSKNNYKICHAYQASYGGMAAYFYKLFCPKSEFVLTLQEGKNLDELPWLKRSLIKKLIKKADVVTAISRYLVDYAKRFSKKEILLIPNGVNFPNSSLDIELSEKSSDQLTILSVSRFVPKNGLSDLIKAFRLVSQKINARLILVGRGGLETKLRELVDELGLENKVLLPGEINPDQLSKYYRSADVFVRPSLSEGLGNVFLEAMAEGIPVIGTNVGGIPDIIKHGENGFLCEPGNPDKLAEAILELLKDKELQKRFSQNGKAFAANFDWRKISSEMARLYNKTIYE